MQQQGPQKIALSINVIEAVYKVLNGVPAQESRGVLNQLDQEIQMAQLTAQQEAKAREAEAKTKAEREKLKAVENSKKVSKKK